MTLTDSNGARGESIARIGELVGKTEAIADPAARAVAVELLQAVMELHAEAFEPHAGNRLSHHSNGEALAAISADELLSSVLVLHGLHPDDTETRLRRAVEKLRQFFDVRGGGISVVSLDAARVHLRFSGSRPGAGTAARQIIEDTIYEAAPEIESLVIDGVEERREPGFVPLTDLISLQKA